MRIILEPEVTTSKKNYFAYPYYTFKGQNSPTKYFNIPLLQRDYVWPKEESVRELLNDLHHHIKGLNISPVPQDPANNSAYYYTGTILCESQQTSQNAAVDIMSLVDGQQRITTLYLLNFVGYLLSRFSLENIPVGLTPMKYFIELQNRFLKLTQWENRCFVKNEISDNVNDFFNDESGDKTPTELTRKFQIRIGSEKQRNILEVGLWPFLEPRLKFSDTQISQAFREAIYKSQLSLTNDDRVLTFEAGDVAFVENNRYAQGLLAIIQFINEKIDFGLSVDDRVKDILNHLEAYISHLAMTCIISENENDSFFLFEVLNERGQDLTALDLVKNMILEKGIAPLLQDDFENRWRSIKSNVSILGSRGKADSNFIKYLIRSEGATTSDKQIAYLRNRNPGLRRPIFVTESNLHFFLRMGKAAEILAQLHKNTKSVTAFDNFKASCLQYSSFMRMIGFDWGQQVIIGSNLIYLASSNYSISPFGISNSLHEQNNWTSTQKNSNSPDLKHFSQFLADILLKIGLVGIINKLSEGALPLCSKKILDLIISHVSTHGNQSANSRYLRDLISQIRFVSQDILNTNNRIDFTARLNNEFYVNTNAKKNQAKILLYLIYARKSAVQYNKPQLEHFEPVSAPDPIIPPYYNEGDRLLIINKLGNFFLIDGQINSSFNNRTIVQKLTMAMNNYPTNPVFQINLFKNVNYLLPNPITNDPIHGQLPVIKKASTNIPSPTDSFKIDDTPTRYFFTARTELISNLAADYIFEDDKFLSDGSLYLS